MGLELLVAGATAGGADGPAVKELEAILLMATAVQG